VRDVCLCQACELDVLTTVIKWGEFQLVKRLEERGTVMIFIVNCIFGFISVRYWQS